MPVKLSVTIESLEAYLTLASIPGVTVDLPNTPAKLTTHTITKYPRREVSNPVRTVSDNIVYKAHPKRKRYYMIDVDATLAKHNATLNTILSHKWKVGTWQHSVKKAARCTHLQRTA